MRLISLEVENFLKFERLALEFPDGLTGVLGPNGVGKSSLVEAVAWALYGSPVSRTRNEGIPFRHHLPCRDASRRLVRSMPTSVGTRGRPPLSQIGRA